MSPMLARSPRKLNEQTQHLTGELRIWSPDRLCFRPSGEAWSALELLEHLRLTEGTVLATMRRNLRAGNRVTMLDRFRSGLILGIMLLPTRLQLPGAVKSILPGGVEKDLSALRQEWADDRKELTGFLESLSSSDREKGVFRHPFGGWTTANDALLFLRSHLHHSSLPAGSASAGMERAGRMLIGGDSKRSSGDGFWWALFGRRSCSSRFPDMHRTYSRQRSRTNTSACVTPTGTGGHWSKTRRKSIWMPLFAYLASFCTRENGRDVDDRASAPAAGIVRRSPIERRRSQYAISRDKP